MLPSGTPAALLSSAAGWPGDWVASCMPAESLVIGCRPIARLPSSSSQGQAASGRRSTSSCSFPLAGRPVSHCLAATSKASPAGDCPAARRTLPSSTMLIHVAKPACLPCKRGVRQITTLCVSCAALASLMLLNLQGQYSTNWRLCETAIKPCRDCSSFWATKLDKALAGWRHQR